MPRPRANIAGKHPVATGLTSQQLALLDREAKERALFSARTTEQRYVAAMQDVLEDLVAGDIDLAGARKRLKGILDDFGYTPEHGFPDAEAVEAAKPGTIEDLSSFGRLNLVMDTNEGMAASVSRLAEETDETLDLFPAWRLVRFMEPNGEPRDWALRWAVAGEEVNWEGACREEMVARKDSPIWQALGDGAGGFTDTLGNPYPPFAFNSGMGWEDVDRDEAEALGLELDEPVRIERPSLGVSEAEVDLAREHYGDTFANLLLGEYGMANEEKRCRKDGTFLDEHGVCHSTRHEGHADDESYAGYRKMAQERPEAFRAASEQLAAFKDRKTGKPKYSNIEDLFAQAKAVPPERIERLKEGFNDVCPLHEAVAFLTAKPKVTDVTGATISFDRWLVSHYLLGDRRRDNEPKLGNLRELPRAVLAIRTRQPFPKPNKRGVAQFQYSLAHPETNAYVYCDSGVVSGWHVVHFKR